MNKSELTEALALKMDIEPKDATGIINTIMDTMTDTLSNGDGVEIRGFGSFKIKEYNGYTGRNPKTGERIKVKSKKLPFFKVGKELAERVNR